MNYQNYSTPLGNYSMAPSFKGGTASLHKQASNNSGSEGVIDTIQPEALGADTSAADAQAVEDTGMATWESIYGSK